MKLHLEAPSAASFLSKNGSVTLCLPPQRPLSPPGGYSRQLFFLYLFVPRHLRSQHKFLLKCI